MRNIHWAVVVLVLSCGIRGVSEDSATRQSPVTALAVAPGGNLIVGSSSSLQIYKKNSEGIELLPKPLKTGLTEIQAMSFSPDGKLFAVAGGAPAERGVVELFDWSSSREKKPVLLERVECHSDVVADVAWSPSGKQLATGSLDATWQLFDVTGSATGRARIKAVRKIEGHSRGVTAVNFLSDGQIVTASLDSTIRVWEASTGKLVRTLSNHRGEVFAMSVRPEVGDQTRPMLASVSKDRTVRLWQPTIGRLVRFAQLDSVPLAVAWLPDGSRIVVACRDGSVRLVDPDSVETVWSHQTPGSRLWTVAVQKDGKRMFAGGVARSGGVGPAFWSLNLR
jgi:WD40 repeat protein